MKNTITLPSGEIVHDFRPNHLRWGWNGLSYKVADDKLSAKMIGIGSGIKAREFVMITVNETDQVSKIESITYYTNPPDMFTAKLTGSYELSEDEMKLFN